MGKIFDALEKASKQSSPKGSSTAGKEKRMDRDRAGTEIAVPVGKPKNRLSARNSDRNPAVDPSPRSVETELSKVLEAESFSRSEIQEIVGIDNKQLHLIAHKGMIDPVLSNDSKARFTQLDCVRLKIIKRADELGYGSEGLLNLIGSPDVVLKEKDPVAACERFAFEKYKQIYDELNDCEPLEQINKQCDLRLLTGYIKLLRELLKNTLA